MTTTRKSREVEAMLDQLKYETAMELGIETGADQTARANGAVGGHMVKRLIQIAEQQIAGK